MPLSVRMHMDIVYSTEYGVHNVHIEKKKKAQDRRFFRSKLSNQVEHLGFTHIPPVPNVSMSGSKKVPDRLPPPLSLAFGDDLGGELQMFQLVSNYVNE